MASIKKICLYDTEGIKSYFKKGQVIAYGNGRYYERVKSHLEIIGLRFDDVLITKDNQVISLSGKLDNDLLNKSTIVICSTFYDEIYSIIRSNNIDNDVVVIEIHCGDDYYASIYKKQISREVTLNHKNIINKVNNKEKIKVVFPTFQQGIFKLDLIFKKFLNDDRFEPVVLVAPNFSYGKEYALKVINDLYNYFVNKNYPVISSYLPEDNRWLSLEEIGTDIVFFIQPYDFTNKEYYQDAYLNYLGCYAGYGVNTVKLRDNLQFNQVFHNAQWINFANSKFVFETYKKESSSGAKNVELTGDLTCEELLSAEVSNLKVWKSKDTRKRIIYAPHHSIDSDNELNYGISTFLIYAEFFKSLAKSNKDKLVWAFKPHPSLKARLYSHPDWGVDRTDKYYDFWKSNEFTQLEEFSYIDLFKTSDAMIHDSASFLYEYLTLKKPVMYLISKTTSNSLNDLGTEALSSCTQGVNKESITNFVEEVIEGVVKITDEHEKFYKKEFVELYYNETPSDRMFNSIVTKLGI